MEDFFTKDYRGGAFVLFGSTHLVSLAILALFNLSLIYFRRVATEESKKIFRYALTATIAVSELSWHWWCIATGQWSIQTELPLHLCSVTALASIFLLITRNEKIYPLVYFLGIGGAMQTLITPHVGIKTIALLKQVFRSNQFLAFNSFALNSFAICF